MALSIEKFFTVLKDGEWHSLDELEDQLGIHASKLVELSKLLSNHGVLKYEDVNNRIKLEHMWKLLLPEEDELSEPKTTIATMVLPPGTSIDVQSTHIANLNNVELEINLQIGSKINEIAIKI
jgi:hypothetical protein